MADAGNVIVWIDNRPSGEIQDEVSQLRENTYPGCNFQFLNPRFFEHPQTVGVFWTKVVAVVLATSSRAVHEGYRILFAGDAAGTLQRPLHTLIESDPAIGSAAGGEEPPAFPSPEDTPAMRCLVYVDPEATDNRRADYLRTQARQHFPGLSLMDQSSAAFERPFTERVAGVVVEEQYPQIAQAYQDQGIKVHVIPRSSLDALSLSSSDERIEVDIESAQAILSLPLDALDDLLANTFDSLFLLACADLETVDQNRPEIHQLLHNRLKALGSSNPHLGNDQGQGQGQERPETGVEGPIEGQEGSEAPEGGPPSISPEIEALSQKTVEEMKKELTGLNIDQCIELYAAEEKGRNRISAMRAIQEQMEMIAQAGTPDPEPNAS